MANKLIRNSAKLLSANVLAQAIGLAIYPVLTRLYAPEDFGELNVFLSLGSIITLVSTAEFQYAIVLPKDDKKAWNLVQCALIVLAITTLCCIWKPLLALYVLTMGIWTLMNYWYTRQQQFGSISRYQIGQSVGSAAIKTGMAYTPVSGGLIWGSVLAPLVSLVTNWWYAGRKSVGEHLRTPWRKEELMAASREYKNFPCYNLPRSLTNTLSGNLPTLLLTTPFGLSEVGFFGMALTLGMRPIQMIAQSLYQPMFQKVSEKVNQRKSILPLHLRYAVWIMVGGVAIGLLYPIIPLMVCILLGEGWDETAKLVQIMLPWFALILVGAPLAYIGDVFQKQRLFFLLEVIGLVLRIGSILIAIHLDNFLWAIGLISISASLMIVIQLIIYAVLIARYEKSLQREIL